MADEDRGAEIRTDFITMRFRVDSLEKSVEVLKRQAEKVNIIETKMGFVEASVLRLYTISSGIIIAGIGAVLTFLLTK